jgi:hypothetical protein
MSGGETEAKVRRSQGMGSALPIIDSRTVYWSHGRTPESNHALRWKVDCSRQNVPIGLMGLVYAPWQCHSKTPRPGDCGMTSETSGSAHKEMQRTTIRFPYVICCLAVDVLAAVFSRGCGSLFPKVHHWESGRLSTAQ